MFIYKRVEKLIFYFLMDSYPRILVISLIFNHILSLSLSLFLSPYFIMPFNTNITSLVLPPQNICIPFWVYEQLKEYINRHRHLHDDIKSELRSHIGNFIGFSSPLSGWESYSPFFGRVLLSFPSYQTKTVIKNIGRNIKQTMKSIPTREKTGKIIFVRVFKLTKNTLYRPSNDINGPIPRDGSHSAIIIISNSKKMTDAYSAIQETQVELGLSLIHI